MQTIRLADIDVSRGCLRERETTVVRDRNTTVPCSVAVYG
jgi:hypothetical protein